MNPEQLLAHFHRISEAPDAIPRLRRFILDLAVRGKLVEQDPRDEPASALLKRIQAEKARLVKEGAIKRQSESATVVGERPDFVTPPAWVLTTLGEVAHKITDGAHKTPTYVEKGVPFVSVKDFSGGRLDFSYTRFISPEEHAMLYKRCDPRRGDILIGRIGTLGKAVLVDTDNEFSLFVSVGLIRFSHDFIAPVFFRLLLNSPHVESEFDRIKIGGGTHTNKLNLGDLHTIVVPLPPLAEQHRIVAKVDELMALCDRLEAAQTERESQRDRLVASSLHRLNNGADADAFQDHARFYFNHLPRLTTRPDHIKQLRQTILNLAVQGKLVEQDPRDEPASELLKHIEKEKARLVKEGVIKKQEELTPIDRSNVPFDVPSSWNWIRIGSAAYVEMGQSPPSEHYNRSGKGISFFQGKADFGVRHPTPRYWCTQPKKLAKAGDILISVRAPVGPTNMAYEECCIGRGLAALRPYDGTTTEFLLQSLKSFESTLESLGFGTTFVAINKKQLISFTIPLPPLAEQHRIVAKIDELMSLCNQLETQLTTTQTETHNLLNSLLTETLSKQTAKD